MLSQEREGNAFRRAFEAAPAGALARVLDLQSAVRELVALGSMSGEEASAFVSRLLYRSAGYQFSKGMA